MTSRNRDKGRATFRDVKRDIMVKIRDGTWPAGALIPSEMDLAKRYGCARATVNRAMRELAEAGILERKRKAGTRVRVAPLRQARFDIPLVRKEIEALGQRYRYRLLLSACETAPTAIQAYLALPTPAAALHVICLHFADDKPYQLEDRWISLTALPQAQNIDFTTLGPNEWLVKTVPFSTAEISVSALSADANLAAYFSCPVGTPLFVMERTTWWQDQALTHVRLHFRPGHKMTTRY